MLWIKAFHIVFMVTWFAGLFYLPRLFVHHTGVTDEAGYARFVMMERKLFAIMTIGAVLTIAFGAWLIVLAPGLLALDWLRVKLIVVALLVAYHAWCYRLMVDFAARRNQRTHVWYRWFNEAPSIALVAIVVLAVVRPF